nr:hypothetical protein [Cressdnaviricota sp.]
MEVNPPAVISIMLYLSSIALSSFFATYFLTAVETVAVFFVVFLVLETMILYIY